MPTLKSFGEEPR